MSQKFSWFMRIIGVTTTVTGLLITTGIAYAAVPVLSQSGITVGLGQSISITSENNNDVYMELNSSPTIATASINGTQVTVTGRALGSTSITLCTVGTASDCTNLNVIVQAASVSGISFSQSSLSQSIGSSQYVTISGGNGTYTVSGNSNTSAVSTSLSGNSLTVSGLAVGGATITVCDTSNTCGTLSVTINSSSSSGLSFSQNNISLMTGGSQVITVSGGNGTYHISNDSNSSAVSVGTSNSNGITVYALAAGSATITVCDTSNTCGTLTVTATVPTTSQAITFSTTNPTLTVGQSLNVSLSGNASNYFIMANSNANIAQGSIISGTTLSLSGISAGTDSLTVCAMGGSGCGTLSVTVTGAANTNTTTTTTTTPTQQSTTPITQPAGTVVANTALQSEIKTLQAAVSQILTLIQSVQTQINQLSSQVNAGSGSNINTNTGTATNNSSAVSSGGTFTELLTLGSQDSQVSALQQQLTTLGFYSGSITGFYGTLTQQAVMKYQTSHRITATGYVGPSTRTALNAGN